jgi:CelD/BcsL family acetyltransferase involved in cellulose biosynthesis
MKIDLLTDASAFEKLHAEWNDLLNRSVSNTLFLTWEWQSTWWEHLGAGELRIITVREEDGTLIGIVPLFEETWKDGTPALSLIGCVDVSDYLDVIAGRGHAERVYAALLDTITQADFPHWGGGLHLCTLPESSPTNARLKALAEARGLAVEWTLHDVSPVIDLPATWDAYLEMLDKKQRHEVRRKLRRVEAADHRWYTVDATMPIDQAIADFIDLHKKSRPDKHVFMDRRMEQFFVDITRRLQPRGWLQLNFLEIAGVRAASLLNFVYQNDVLVYNSGYDPEKYGSYSPGIVLFAFSIQDAITARRRRYDFLRGNEEYKYRFGAHDTNVYELHIRRRGDS